MTLSRIAARSLLMPSGCIEWTGMVNRQGYGRIYSGGRMMLVHRLAWILANGPTEDGQCVLHHCDNPPCHNLAHLFLGTRGENNADKIAKGRDYNQQKTHCPQGHPYSGQNLMFQKKSGGRKCRLCQAAALVRYHERQKVMLSATTLILCAGRSESNRGV